MAEPQSISSLFSDVLGSTNYAATQLEADRKLGEQLQTGSAATLFAPERARRLTQSFGNIVGADTRSPEEIKAAKTKSIVSKAMQSAMAQYPASRAKQLEEVAKVLMANDMTAEASKFRDAAQAAQLQEADITKTQQEAFKNQQQGLEAQQKATTEKLQRPYTLANELAQIQKLQAETGEATAGAALKGVQAEESKKNKELIEAKISDVGMTDYLREVAATDLTEEDKMALNKQRVEVRAKTGGSQYDPNAISTKAIYDRGYEAIDMGMEAIQGFEVADTALQLLPDANTGAWLGLKDAGTWIGANILQLEDAQNTKFASEFVDVLTKDLALAKTTILKGVLSESDMKLIKESVGGRENNPKAIQAAFSKLAATKYSQVKVAKVYDDLLLNPETMLKIPHATVKKAIMDIAKFEYESGLVSRGLLDKSLMPNDAALKSAQAAKKVLEKYGINYVAGI